MEGESGVRLAIVHMKDGPAGSGFVPGHAADRRPERARVLSHSDRVENGQAHGLDNKARPKGAGVIKPFKKRDFMALESGQCGGRKATDSGSDNGNLQTHGQGMPSQSGESKAWLLPRLDQRRCAAYKAAMTAFFAIIHRITGPAR